MLIKAVACMKTHTSVTESRAYVRQGPYINKSVFKIYPGTLVSVLCFFFFFCHARSNSSFFFVGDGSEAQTVEC